MNNFIQKDTFKIWDKLSSSHRKTHLTKLMHTAEQVTLRISQNFQKITQFDTNSSDVGKPKGQFQSNSVFQTFSRNNGVSF